MFGISAIYFTLDIILVPLSARTPETVIDCQGRATTTQIICQGVNVQSPLS
jgi:hypothetical protein